MEDPYSVNSPRRVLSLSRRSKGSPLFSELYEKDRQFGSSSEHGPKPSEVYGFVGAITTVVATGLKVVLFFKVDVIGGSVSVIVIMGFGELFAFLSFSNVNLFVIFLIWAYVPDSWLHSIGISYYPSRYWALAVPTYAMVAIVSGIVFYIGINFMVTPPPTSFNTIFDEYSREPSNFDYSGEGDQQPIEPISDLGLNQINNLMFNDGK